MPTGAEAAADALAATAGAEADDAEGASDAAGATVSRWHAPNDTATSTAATHPQAAGVPRTIRFHPASLTAGPPHLAVGFGWLSSTVTV